MTISLSDPILGEKEKEALSTVIDSRWITMGDRVAAFESAFAKFHKVDNAVAVSSCTAGLHLCLAALNIGPGDEILVPSLTFVATVNAVIYVGATPIFVDIINEDTPHISIKDAKKKCTPRTKGVIVMHYGGYLVDLHEWRSFADAKGIFLIEDAAHAPGVENVGKWCDATVFSFFTNKNMTTAEGGMVTTRDPAISDYVRRMRSHGMTSLTLDRHCGHAYSYDVTVLGYNYRMDELRAAIGLVQLHQLKKWNKKRKELSTSYRTMLSNHIPDVIIPFTKDHETAAHLMPIILPAKIRRHELMHQLRDYGIQTSIHYPPVHHFSYYRNRFPGVSLIKTEGFCARELTLPLHASLKENDVENIVKSLQSAMIDLRI